LHKYDVLLFYIEGLVLTFTVTLHHQRTYRRQQRIKVLTTLFQPLR